MSVLGGILKLQLHCAQKPGIAIETVVHLLRNGAALDGGVDFDGAVELLDNLELLPVDIPYDRYEALRFLVGKIIQHCRPPWAVAIPYGRSQVVRLMTTDEEQCFVSAGLLAPQPASDALLWWDELARLMRALHDDQNAQTGREAEALSLEYERDRLRAAGRPDLEPVWVALDDNSLGYDIRSFEPDGSFRYLEVKGCRSNDLVIYITRNEWRIAQQIGTRYHFHVWNVTARELYDASVAQIALHIPTEHGRGRWQSVRLTILEPPS
jgi:hypothetical protein